MPGYIPWLIDGEEARILINVLEQTLDVAAHAAQNASLLEPPNENAYLIRIPERRGDVYAWKDELVEVLPPGPRSFPVPINHDLLEQMAKLPRRQKTSVELGFLPFPQPMESESGRPYLPLLFVGGRWPLWGCALSRTGVARRGSASPGVENSFPASRRLKRARRLHPARVNRSNPVKSISSKLR